MAIVWGCLQTAALAQGFEFKVLASKGQPEIKNPQGTWEPVKMGATLKKTDVLKLQANAYVGLVHATGRTKELSEAGEFKVADLASQITADGQGVASKYADFVLSKMNKEGSGRYNVVTGAVSRADDGFDIKLFLPKASKMLGQKAAIRWSPIPQAQTYVVLYQNRFDDTLSVTEVTDESHVLDFADASLKDDNFVKVKIYVKGQPDVSSDGYGIQRLKAKSTEDIRQRLAELTQETNQQSPLAKLIEAGFFEENGLLVDALTSYEMAINLMPDVPQFKEMYADFILRNALGK